MLRLSGQRRECRGTVSHSTRRPCLGTREHGGNWRVLEHVLRHTAQDQSRHSTFAMRTQRDGIDLLNLLRTHWRHHESWVPPDDRRTDWHDTQELHVNSALRRQLMLLARKRQE